MDIFSNLVNLLIKNWISIMLFSCLERWKYETKIFEWIYNVVISHLKSKNLNFLNPRISSVSSRGEALIYSCPYLLLPIRKIHEISPNFGPELCVVYKEVMDILLGYPQGTVFCNKKTKRVFGMEY